MDSNFLWVLHSQEIFQEIVDDEMWAIFYFPVCIQLSSASNFNLINFLGWHTICQKVLREIPERGLVKYKQLCCIILKLNFRLRLEKSVVGKSICCV